MTPLADCNGARVYHADWRALLDVVPTCDALIVDAPYSSKVHAGHDSIAIGAGAVTRDDADREPLAYPAWTPADVRAFVEHWHPRTRGWFVSITDHELARAWEEELRRVGRYVFAPLPFVAPGSRVRLLGDGPSCWTTWIVVARRKGQDAQQWGTLPGAYMLPLGQGGAMPVVGGKPLWLLRKLCEDYSRPGDLVVDPCCGAGTTLAAAIRHGRRAVGGDMNADHAAIAARWISDPQPRCPTESEARQAVLF